MINLRWAPFPEADVASYKIYRSIIGFKATIVSLDGLTLELKINDGDLQTFTFNAIDSIVDTINATIEDGQAYTSQDTLSFFVRSNIREAPGSVEIVGGTALTPLGQTARLISELSENELIGTVTALLDPEELVTFEDPNGVLHDFYAITTVDSVSNESAKTNWKQPIASSAPICVIEGIVIDLQGVRITDAKVEAKLINSPQHTSELTNINDTTITAYSGTDGRYSLAIVQGALVILEIESIGYSQHIRVPELAYVFLNDLKVDKDYRYPLGYRGTT